jgi:CotH kinase protein
MGRGSNLCSLTLSIVFALSLASSAFAQADPVLHRTLLQSTNVSAGDCCAKLQAIGFDSPLPVVILDSAGQPIPHGVDTKITLCTCSPASMNVKDYFGPAEAAGRGTSSANFTKKSYKFKTVGADGKSVDFPILGMPQDDDWILYGPELDKTMGMRNYLTYNLARASGRYATRTVYAEVFLVDDGKPLNMEHYNGIYITEEKVKRSKDRVDIKKLKAPNLSGGYIILYDNDNIEATDITFGPLKGWEHPFLLKEPKEFPPEDNPGGSWMLNYLTEFQNALNNGDTSYTDYIDAPAFTDFFLLVELTKSPDGYRGSTYMHKEKDGPLAMGPVWDYNEAYGECCGYPITGWDNQGQSGPGLSGGSAISPEGWRFNICDEPERCIVDPTDGTSQWYRQMWKSDDRFKTGAAQRWKDLRGGVWSDDGIKKVINDAKSAITPAIPRNYDKYATALGVQKGDNYEEFWLGAVSTLQDWTIKRVAWLDSKFGAIAGGGETTAATTTESQAGR